MTHWQPVSELTVEIVESAWRLMLWDGQESWTFDEYVSEDGTQELDEIDGTWQIVWFERVGPFYPFTHFVVIDAPPEA